MILTNLDQHVNEMMTTTEKKFQNFLSSRFLIIVQSVNMVTNGKRNSRLNPDHHTEVSGHLYVSVSVTLFSRNNNVVNNCTII